MRISSFFMVTMIIFGFRVRWLLFVRQRNRLVSTENGLPFLRRNSVLRVIPVLRRELRMNWS
jgi:hypothetical protein